MRKCVAIDKDGRAVGMYDAITEAAMQMGLLPGRIRQAIVNKTIVNDLKWMYEEDYMAYVSKGNADKLAWGKDNKRHKHFAFETLVRMRATKQRNREYRKKVIADSFRAFTKCHVAWMKELKDVYLARGDFGIRPEILADYYNDIRDKEIALLVSVMLPMTENTLDAVTRFHSLIGEHPWEWFKERRFSVENQYTFVEKCRIIPFLNEWWREMFKDNDYASLGECVKNVSERDGISYLDMMIRTKKVSMLRLATVLLVFSRCDGFGQGLWNIDREDIKIPVRSVLITFLQTWFPDCTKYGELDECIELFGMDSIDFFYCYLAYEELKKFRPKECARYVNFYSEAYKRHTHHKPYVWLTKSPKIDFSLEKMQNEWEIRDC